MILFFRGPLEKARNYIPALLTVKIPQIRQKFVARNGLFESIDLKTFATTRDACYSRGIALFDQILLTDRVS